MENIQSILDFMDGTLGATAEQELFTNLTYSEELRAELKYQISIRDVVLSDAKALSPSPQSTLNIFQTLGFTTPVANLASTTGGAVLSSGDAINKVSFWTKYGSTIGFSLLSAITTAVIFFIFFKPMGNLNINNSSINPTGEISINKNILESKPESMNQQGISKIDQKTQNTAPRTIIKYIYIKDHNNEKTDTYPKDNLISKQDGNLIQVPSATNIINRIDNSVICNQSIVKINKDNNEIYSGQQLLGEITYNKLSESPIQSDKDFRIELKNSEIWSLPKANIAPSEYSKFNKMNASFIYQFNKTIAAGIELKQETFFQTFTGVDSLGNTYRYEQQPNLTTIGLAIRLNLGSYGIFSPVVQISTGLNRAGLTAGGMLGAEFEAYPGLSFIFDTDFSNLFYKHQSKTFNSSKIGFNYGLSFKF